MRIHQLSPLDALTSRYARQLRASVRWRTHGGNVVAVLAPKLRTAIRRVRGGPLPYFLASFAAS
jgi:hypothetical protein